MGIILEENLSTPIQVGNRIYERRKQINMTQETLSELIGSTPQAVSNYEKGERELKAGAAVKVAKALRVTTDWLLTGESEAVFIESELGELTYENRRIINDIIEKCIELTKKQADRS